MSNVFTIRRSVWIELFEIDIYSRHIRRVNFNFPYKTTFSKRKYVISTNWRNETNHKYAPTVIFISLFIINIIAHFRV